MGVGRGSRRNVSLGRRLQQVLSFPPAPLFLRPALGGFEPAVLAEEGVGLGGLVFELELAVPLVCERRS